ncbi:2Fe-2S iron-sulfur cluster-binding protein [Kribbella solani]|uniref:2Fe-2S iron-sulfur cluster-binding protein n=1 Tax=Kribbella solani TaxID=236067 RepID=UPI0029AA2EF8|nr:2Fe-2S iron-sulfur cluster-binding protein [Kribbella solani]MDX2972248.1 2Fe-2S iron-sulfur cluster-binding protein [Kribbella solani]
MQKATFHYGGTPAEVVEVDADVSLMRAAVTNGVAGIVGECGGQAMCATCHVYVREQYLDALPAIGADEDEMLDCTVAPRDPVRSRLACQLTLGPGLDEIEVDVPEQQV